VTGIRTNYFFGENWRALPDVFMARIIPRENIFLFNGNSRAQPSRHKTVDDTDNIAAKHFAMAFRLRLGISGE
jgi:hypothetical protein